MNFPGTVWNMDDLIIADDDVLSSLDGRSICRTCNSSRKWYCYKCCCLASAIDTDRVPRIKLPVKIDIVKHCLEVDGKSTAPHAVVLAPNDVSMFTYPKLPTINNKNRVLLVFPSDNSKTLSEISHEITDWKPCSNGGCSKSEEEVAPKSSDSNDDPKLGTMKNVEEQFDELERVIFIDSTWYQTHRIITDQRFDGVRHVRLNDYKTCFWRTQKNKPDTYLATIEAIYFFLREYHEEVLKQPYNGEYDNILFFYKHLYNLVKMKTAERQLERELLVEKR